MMKCGRKRPRRRTTGFIDKTIPARKESDLQMTDQTVRNTQKQDRSHTSQKVVHATEDFENGSDNLTAHILGTVSTSFGPR